MSDTPTHLPGTPSSTEPCPHRVHTAPQQAVIQQCTACGQTYVVSISEPAVDPGGRPVTVTLTERDLHVLCNAADGMTWFWRKRREQPESIEAVTRITEAMRSAWVDQVTTMTNQEGNR